MIATALAKDPDDRQQTGARLVVNVGTALGIAEPVQSGWLRAPVLAAAIGLALVAAGLASYFALRGGGAPQPRRDTLVRIDPATNEVVESIPVGPEASSVTVGDGYLWVTSYEDRTLWRIDPETGATRVTPGQRGNTAGRRRPRRARRRGERAVRDQLRADRRELRRDRRDDSPPRGESEQASVALGDYGIWVAACGLDGGSVARVSTRPRAASPPGRVPVFPTDPDWLFYTTPDAGGYNDVAVGAGGVWLARDGGSVLKRIDPETREVVATIELPFTAKSLAAGTDALWVAAILEDVVARLDPATNEITMTVPVGRGADGVALGEGSVWVASTIDRAVSQIDPSTGSRARDDRCRGTSGGRRGWRRRRLGHDTHGMTARSLLAALAVSLALLASSCGGEAPIRIGVITDCEGFLAAFNDVALAGSELPLIRRGATLTGAGPGQGLDGASIAGRPVKLFFGCAPDATRELPGGDPAARRRRGRRRVGGLQLPVDRSSVRRIRASAPA